MLGLEQPLLVGQGAAPVPQVPEQRAQGQVQAVRLEREQALQVVALRAQPPERVAVRPGPPGVVQQQERLEPPPVGEPPEQRQLRHRLLLSSNLCDRFGVDVCADRSRD